jgi:hypothetical protein
LVAAADMQIITPGAEWPAPTIVAVFNVTPLAILGDTSGVRLDVKMEPRVLLPTPTRPCYFLLELIVMTTAGDVVIPLAFDTDGNTGTLEAIGKVVQGEAWLALCPMRPPYRHWGSLFTMLYRWSKKGAVLLDWLPPGTRAVLDLVGEAKQCQERLQTQPGRHPARG